MRGLLFFFTLATFLFLQIQPVFGQSVGKMELVWPQYKKPYLQTITKKDNGVDIARMLLSDKP